MNTIVICCTIIVVAWIVGNVILTMNGHKPTMIFGWIKSLFDRRKEKKEDVPFQCVIQRPSCTQAYQEKDEAAAKLQQQYNTDIEGAADEQIEKEEFKNVKTVETFSRQFSADNAAKEVDGLLASTGLDKIKTVPVVESGREPSGAPKVKCIKCGIIQNEYDTFREGYIKEDGTWICHICYQTSKACYQPRPSSEIVDAPIYDTNIEAEADNQVYLGELQGVGLTTADGVRKPVLPANAVECYVCKAPVGRRRVLTTDLDAKGRWRCELCHDKVLNEFTGKLEPRQESHIPVSDVDMAKTKKSTKKSTKKATKKKVKK